MHLEREQMAKKLAINRCLPKSFERGIVVCGNALAWGLFRNAPRRLGEAERWSSSSKTAKLRIRCYVTSIPLTLAFSDLEDAWLAQ